MMTAVYTLSFLGVLLVLSATRLFLSHRGWRLRGEQQDPNYHNTIYDHAEPIAHFVKAVLQMSIGLIVIWTVGLHFLELVTDRHADRSSDAIALLLNDVGVGLAAAAVVELAYTLFTSGPDEALDPLMLGLSAAILIELSRNGIDLNKAAALILLGLLLAILFAIRLFLAENHDEDPTPRIWWIPRRSQTARPIGARTESATTPVIEK